MSPAGPRAATLAPCAGVGGLAGLAAGISAPGFTAGTVAAVVLVYATQGLAGALLAGALEPSDAPRTATERLARALLLGPLALAAQMLLMAVIGFPFGVAAIVTPWWLLAAVAPWSSRRAATSGAGTVRDPAVLRGAVRLPSGGVRTAVLALACALVLLSLAIGLQTPVHTGDAMNNYAVSARVFETHRGLAPEALASLTVPGRTENPPLVALNEALVFLAAGEARGWAVKPFFTLAYAALLLLVIEACFRGLPARRAAPVAAVALFTPIWAAQAAVGYADLRLTACVLLLALEGRALWRAPSARGLAGFAVAALACAALKHEGVAVAALACGLPILLAARRRLAAGRAAASVVATAALAVAWPFYAARTASMPLPLVVAVWHDVGRALAQLPDALARMGALTVDADAGGHPFWGVAWPAAAALAVVGLLRPACRSAVLGVLAAFLVHAGLYVVVFALSPEDLAWHVLTAGTRLLVHLSPWALLAAVAALGPPPARDGTTVAARSDSATRDGAPVS